MKTSSKGIAFLAAHEGIVPGPYLDSVKVWTFGIGHTKAAGAPDPATMPRGMPVNLDKALENVFDVFQGDLATYEATVSKALQGIPNVQQHQYDAAVSFHYNTGAIATATWVKTWRSGNLSLAADQMMNWRSPPEIIPRREDEQELFETGVYRNTTATVWGVKTSGAVIWQAITTLTEADIVGMLAHQPTEGPTLRYGDRGDDVRSLQSFLADAGYSPGKPDGIWGDGTQKALEAFHAAKRIDEREAICGPATWAALA